ncbi:hypothetical protein QO004_003781 [Rhizobium mesoamericanum]|uniref:hypothetical protein n=1 Tax=Rhizobium mesoamericanum TaxID=1079800 RepID=UPI0027877FAE|nr:hypothetical protein [Rhizobium mesoamericanum]MDQ0561980.1 hypothetical protein [Rhizobium mesoamericanum]
MPFAFNQLERGFEATDWTYDHCALLLKLISQLVSEHVLVFDDEDTKTSYAVLRHVLPP